MSVSDKIATLNIALPQISTPFTLKMQTGRLSPSRGCIYGLDAESLDATALDFAQAHIRILPDYTAY